MIIRNEQSVHLACLHNEVLRGCQTQPKLCMPKNIHDTQHFSTIKM